MTEPVPDRCHPSHKTVGSFDSSFYDERCERCGATDIAGGGWGSLKYPCPKADTLPIVERLRGIASYLYELDVDPLNGRSRDVNQSADLIEELVGALEGIAKGRACYCTIDGDGNKIGGLCTRCKATKVLARARGEPKP